MAEHPVLGNSLGAQRTLRPVLIHVRLVSGVCLWAVLSAVALAAAGQDADLDRVGQAITAAREGATESAARLAAEAVETCSGKPDPAACELTTRILLAQNFGLAAAYELALSEARAAAKVAKAESRESHLSVLLLLARAAARAGELDEAERAIAGGQRVTDELVGQSSGTAASRMKRLSGMFGGPQALVYSARGEHVRAAAAQRKLVRTMRSFDPQHPNLPVEMLTLALMQEAASDPGAARTTYAEVELLAEQLGDRDALARAKTAIARMEARVGR